MVDKYYVDTSIWMDLYEDRRGFKKEPLGNFALKLFNLILLKNEILIISDILLKELELNYSLEEINGMVLPFKTQQVLSTSIQKFEAKSVSQDRNLPPGDALHAILARDNNAILITRDRHFEQLLDISSYKKPEDII